jgi:hypothetical protein
MLMGKNDMPTTALEGERLLLRLRQTLITLEEVSVERETLDAHVSLNQAAVCVQDELSGAIDQPKAAFKDVLKF